MNVRRTGSKRETSYMTEMHQCFIAAIRVVLRCQTDVVKFKWSASEDVGISSHFHALNSIAPSGSYTHGSYHAFVRCPSVPALTYNIAVHVNFHL